MSSKRQIPCLYYVSSPGSSLPLHCKQASTADSGQNIFSRTVFASLGHFWNRPETKATKAVTMAPRGRSRKARITRMDAAIDAMTKTYGFSEEIVTKVLKELLKEYGGDDGWFFIEQYSYRELVDAILRYQEENDKEQDNLSKDKPDTLPESGSLEDEKAEEDSLADADMTSGILTEIICSKTIDNGIDTNNRVVGPLPPTKRDGRGWKDIGLDESSSHRGRADAICGKDEKSGPSLILSPSPLTPTTPLGTSVPTRPDNSPVPSLPRISPLPVKSIQSKKRQPCYGWIENDEEDVDDFIHLTPGVEWENSIWMSDKKAKQATLDFGTKDS